MSRKIDLDGTSRRRFLSGCIGLGALLGVRPFRIFETIEDTAGSALAAEAACLPNNRSVHLVANVGGLAWFQLLWPHVDVAMAQNDTFAYHAPGQGQLLPGTDKPLFVSPQAPWQSYAARKAVTAFMAGVNETHTQAPVSSTTIATGLSAIAACAAIQSTAPTLVPAIRVGALSFGGARGAPMVATVGSSDDLVGLFDSAASRATGALAKAEDAQLYQAYHRALQSLVASARLPTQRRSAETARVAANLLGRNLSSRLRPSQDDLTRYGISLGTPSKLANLAKGLITTAKAFELGLTSCVMLPAMSDDPHGAFANMPTLVSTVTTLGKILDAFMTDLMAIEDPLCAGRKLGDNVVITVHGDTPKTPLRRSGWPDGTPGNSNWLYVLGAGHLKTGWFGGISRAGAVTTFDPATGGSSMAAASTTAPAAAAAVVYAVAKGDARRVSDFYRGPLDGIVRAALQ